MRRRLILTAPKLLAVLVAPAWIAGCSPTATYGTGESPEIAMFREMTGGFLGERKEEEIEYQPRAPLVLPPSAEELPAPADTAAATSPDWPVGRDERIAAMRPDESNDPRHGGSQAEYRRLKPLVGVLPSAPAVENEGSPYAIVNNKRQREEFRKALAEAEGYGQSSERRFLTDPPTQYREPSASAPAEFENINGSGGSSGGGWLRWLMGGRR